MKTHIYSTYITILHVYINTHIQTHTHTYTHILINYIILHEYLST